MQHTSTERQFFDYLLAKSFPQDSIISQPAIGEKARPDFAIVDKKKDEVLAVFEVKARVSSHPLSDAYSQLRLLTASFRALGVSAFLVLPSSSPSPSEPFQFYRQRNDGEIEEVPAAHLPTFEALVAGKSALKKDEIKREQKDTTDEFRRICAYIALLCLVLIGVDIYFSWSGLKFEVLTTQRITLLGAAISLFIIPYAQKIKALGFEYERAATKKE